MPTPTEITVRPAALDDIQELTPILEFWVRDRDTGQLLTDEVASIQTAIRDSIEGQTDRKYFIAQDGEGRVIGMMGLTAVSEAMRPYATTGQPLEIVNAFAENRGKGVGRALLDAVQKSAQDAGGTELIVNSGPRYKDAWAFYDRQFGPRVAMAEGLYGPGGDAPVWRRVITG